MSAAPTPDEAMRFMFAALVHQQIDLSGPWEGWRVRGRELVSPEGQRLPVRRLEGLLWREAMELRRAGFASRKQAERARREAQLVKVVVVPLRDFLDGRTLAAA